MKKMVSGLIALALFCSFGTSVFAATPTQQAATTVNTVSVATDTSTLQDVNGVLGFTVNVVPIKIL